MEKKTFQTFYSRSMRVNWKEKPHWIAKRKVKLNLRGKKCKMIKLIHEAWCQDYNKKFLLSCSNSSCYSMLNFFHFSLAIPVYIRFDDNIKSIPLVCRLWMNFYYVSKVFPFLPHSTSFSFSTQSFIEWIVKLYWTWRRREKWRKWREKTWCRYQQWKK